MIPLFRRASSKARTRRSHRMPELNDPEIYQAVLDSLQTGVYIVDRNRRIRFWNEGAEQITGYLRQDVVGRFLRDHLADYRRDAKDVDSDPDDPINLVFRDGKPSTMDVSILHKDGYRVPIVLRTIPIRNSHGAVVGAAESFEKNRSASDWTRRQAGLADFGCLDAVTGVAAQSFMETQLRENLTTFAEHNIPFGILLIQIDHMDQFRASRGPGVVPTILARDCAVGGELRAPDRSCRVLGRESIYRDSVGVQGIRGGPGRGAGQKNDWPGGD